jgi:hypothetical protein
MLLFNHLENPGGNDAREDGKEQNTGDPSVHLDNNYPSINIPKYLF